MLRRPIATIFQKFGYLSQIFCEQNIANRTTQTGRFEFVVGAKGFEPSTPCSQSKYSTRLSYAPMRHKLYIIFYLTQVLFVRKKTITFFLLLSNASSALVNSFNKLVPSATKASNLSNSFLA